MYNDAIFYLWMDSVTLLFGWLVGQLVNHSASQSVILVQASLI
jgi:hypothetical protein